MSLRVLDIYVSLCKLYFCISIPSILPLVAILPSSVTAYFRIQQAAYHLGPSNNEVKYFFEGIKLTISLRIIDHHNSGNAHSGYIMYPLTAAADSQTC